MFTVNIDGKEHEVSVENLKPTKEGYAIITPDSVPDGYFTQEAFETKIKGRLSKAEENAKEKLLEDKSFHKNLFNQYGVQIGDDGKPVGLKPTVDVDDIKRTVAESVKGEYEEKIGKLRSTLDNFKSKGKTSAILDGANSIGIDGKYMQPLYEGGSPYLVKELESLFDYNEEIGDYALLDKDGTFAVDGSGFITSKKFFEKNKDRYKDMLKDQRQRGSNYAGAGNGGVSTPKGDPSKWSLSTKTQFIAQNGGEAYKKALQSFKASKNE